MLSRFLLYLPGLVGISSRADVCSVSDDQTPGVLASDVVCREITRPPDALASVGFLLIVFPVHGLRCFRMANPRLCRPHCFLASHIGEVLVRGAFSGI